MGVALGLRRLAIKEKKKKKKEKGRREKREDRENPRSGI